MFARALPAGLLALLVTTGPLLTELPTHLAARCLPQEMRADPERDECVGVGSFSFLGPSMTSEADLDANQTGSIGTSSSPAAPMPEAQ